jgi:hypothetical protein
MKRPEDDKLLHILTGESDRWYQQAGKYPCIEAV